ncbi:hypothetical protein GTU73_02470 [Rathayibacter sp. VKM Ac-2804]|jgi:hypothetical protein|uniref:hypothetical protein n=1 Tax=unclassified Rathayibacter TaxID=2609250 RepID=UPI00132F2A37|nr:MULTISPECIES: hypothetical protein [unclassified Rathayibacter]NRG42503.1 hypothetical protein [Rathayibacter sp. VKM Ac-2835]QHF22978.1 hypothetical protein GTU73_02470 [Rathayibacter sp. VKM Ac-2804]
MTTTTHDRDLWAPDFLQLAGPAHSSAVFACSTTLRGVTGSLCVTEGVLVLGGSQPTVQLRAADIRSWWDTPAGGTFSLAVESGARHSVVLLSQFRGATVHAMTQAFGPRRRRIAA